MPKCDVGTRIGLGMFSLFVLIPTMVSSLIPQTVPFVSRLLPRAPIDNYAHIGGLLTGILAGLLLWCFWPRGSKRPTSRWLAALVSLGFVAVAVIMIGLSAVAIH